MERSVSVVLPDLPTGSYVVYLKVTSERDSNAQSVEQVVKREAADRTENKKLAQDQQKASACRQKVLRRWWEKRSINRDVTTQQSKNFEKRKGRRAEREAEQNFLNEEFNAMVMAEREKKAEEAGDEALSKKTEEIEISEDKDEPVVVNEHHNGRDDAVISVSTGSPHLTLSQWALQPKVLERNKKFHPLAEALLLPSRKKSLSPSPLAQPTTQQVNPPTPPSKNGKPSTAATT
ncbi:hypothetical protein FocTR4_00017157 [Fusarium oxysporum f. sp. cubense]|uniref:Uncharacterized protein n=1 Tax=Fusarium oxysporum f. sp. cubense TaxID=61366 RepID=A0A5C6SHK6_FUSOC|nr:hypothetical protein FocTR4_00017157 [Fusarium oxysporum f. sp. cubense]